MNLSLVLCSRNDEYMGNSRWRLETTLNHLGERVAALGCANDVEVLVTDWGSDVPLRDVVVLDPAARAIVSFVTVPPPLARTLQGDSPFPEVLALNAAARRARGRYIGRIDQDTLVGDRFLRWFFDTIERDQPLPSGAMPRDALFFSGRRNIPYRVAASSPAAGDVTAAVRWCGELLPVCRETPVAGDPFWTGSVGIWLAHRDLWHECGGYDERLIYYNWMETDMIGRLRQSHAVVDLGELTGYDFYHLEHVDPRRAVSERRHPHKNASIDPAMPPAVVHPNAETWGLRDYALAVERGAQGFADPHGPRRSTSAEERRSTRADERGGPARLFLRLAAALTIDRIIVAWSIQHHVWSGRYTRARHEVKERPIASWPRMLWELWSGRTDARVRRMAGVGVRRARTVITAVTSALGLLGVARRMRVRIAVATSEEIRRAGREDHDRFVQFDREYGALLSQRVTSGAASKTALVVSSRCPTIEGELCTIKTLQLAGFTPVVLLEDERRGLRPFYERAGVRDVRMWSEFLGASDYSAAAAAAIRECRTVDDLMASTHAGVRVGMIAVCTVLRRLRLGVLDLQAPGVRALLGRAVAASMSAVAESERILAAVRPDLVLTDPEYTPKGELFESCLNLGLDVVAYSTAHRSHALMLKRYGQQNRDEHLTALSPATWAHVRDLEWTGARRERLAREVSSSYFMGDWFQTPWRQPKTDVLEPAEVRRELGIDPAKKSAFICPHVLWDAPVMWGQPLFPNYQEWLVETVAAACRNDDVNWVIKVHPDHVWKHEEFGYRGNATEIRVLHEQLGALPDHVTVIAPETRISTLSMFPVMDYCVTVRGTVGVEAAMHGIPVLTAGPARYAERGFTIDSAGRREYLGRLSRIQDQPPLSADERELAERFAYGLFVLRPLELTSITWDPSGVPGVGSTAQRRPRIHLRTEDDWRHAADLGALADWFVSRDEDFLTHVE